MLSRVANSLYWLSRYVERAENIARILDVNLQQSLDFHSVNWQHVQEHWLPIVQCTGDQDLFRSRHPQLTAEAVTEFIVFDPENSNSIVSSICLARENARMVRDQITSETWEQLNRLYLFILDPAARQLWLNSPTEFFSEIKTTSLLLTGLSHTTHIHNEGWLFSQIGSFLERADKTSRILDLRSHTLPVRGQPAPLNQTETLAWSAILRSASAWDAFKSIYGAEVTPRNVAELLILNDDFPRSVRACVEQLNDSLRRISGVSHRRFSNHAEKLAGRFVAELQFGTIEEVFTTGLHEYLDQVQLKLNVIGDELFNTYIAHSFQLTETGFVQQEEQQQQQA